MVYTVSNHSEPQNLLTIFLYLNEENEIDVLLGKFHYLTILNDQKKL